MDTNINVNIIDEMMGRGKTASAINYINSLDADTKIIYITPYLEEVERIKNCCKDKKFYEPQNYGTKKRGLKYDLEKGRNIVTTHSLFQYFDGEIIQLCQVQNYILFMDEVADVVERFLLDPVDAKVLTEKYTTVEEGTGRLIWNEEFNQYSKTGVFYKAKKLCENNCLYMYNGTIVVWMFPIKVFHAFSESYILTYMFHAQMQKYYYDFYHINYNYLYVAGDSLETYHFTKEKPTEQNVCNYEELIHIIDNNKLNRIGDKHYALSVSWFRDNSGSSLMAILKNNTYNFFANLVPNGKASNNIWTVFKDYKNEIKGNGYTTGFVPCNMRATNAYKDRQNVAYLINRFYDPNIKNFFSQNGIKVDEEDFALSEMVQFIWRSAIRDGKEIYVYIPSRRMREIFIGWINRLSLENEEETENISVRIN